MVSAKWHLRSQAGGGFTGTLAMTVPSVWFQPAPQPQPQDPRRGTVNPGIFTPMQLRLVNVTPLMPAHYDDVFFSLEYVKREAFWFWQTSWRSHQAMGSR